MEGRRKGEEGKGETAGCRKWTLGPAVRLVPCLGPVERCAKSVRVMQICHAAARSAVPRVGCWGRWDLCFQLIAGVPGSRVLLQSVSTLDDSAQLSKLLKTFALVQHAYFRVGIHLEKRHSSLVDPRLVKVGSPWSCL